MHGPLQACMSLAGLGATATSMLGDIKQLPVAHDIWVQIIELSIEKTWLVKCSPISTTNAETVTSRARML